ncbi:hypothetical protein SAMN04488494_0586 [Xylanibacter ruminicola]|uniref:Uncharacterized protein n=1 Tax=Xylanibacter ruminicola TaxID=839 RepID=A0A1M7D0E7_XYLRU|nr:hypothetical protein [Xylanibacter ruminicola]SHL72981.1 hypothetical protein SAMN04488494_0586 [Xylanibacter ruminicola]
MDNKKIGISIKGKAIELPCDQIQLDLAKGNDKGAINVVNKNGEVTMSFSSKEDVEPFAEWFKETMSKFKKERKTLLWAVTHGYVVTIMMYSEETGDYEMPIHTPKLLKEVFHCVPFVPELNIYTKDGDPCFIHKGRIVKL